MVEFFTRIYPDASSRKNQLLVKICFYSFVRFLIRSVANKVLPLYFNLTKNNGRYQLLSSKPNLDLIVSLTSFPARIKRVHLVIETLLRQTHKPDRIILWLSNDQFQNESGLPKSLIRLKKRGLEIKFREGDLRSYKKFYYVLKEYPESNFIIVDDDVFYPSNLVKNLIRYHKMYPGTVCFNRGYRISHHRGSIMPYDKWQLLADETGPTKSIVPTGIGGVFYPKGVLSKEALNKEVFLEKCRYADDIWLYMMTLMNGRQLVKTNENRLFLPIFNKGNKTLTSINVQRGANDKQLTALCDYYLIKNKFDIVKVLELG